MTVYGITGDNMKTNKTEADWHALVINASEANTHEKNILVCDAYNNALPNSTMAALLFKDGSELRPAPRSDIFQALISR